ncbi:MAG: hypothetical protein IT244_03290, partial [Bacteroidia bacterium]|nr:hypothetical protein [Bacteroidia bacterium]
MVIIYSPETSTRWVYVLDEIFHRRLGVLYTHTSDLQEYLKSAAQIKINYSLEDIEGLKIGPSGLLFQLKVDQNLKPEHFGEKNMLRLFPATGDLGFDIFSMVFWCLSRYEEYQPFAADEHGRFDIGNSYLHKLGVSNFPILDAALNQFYGLCGLVLEDKYQVYPTLDIDIAYKHKGRNIPNWLGGLARAILKGKTELVFERISVLFGEKDPHDAFDYLFQKLQTHKNRVRFFIQTGSRGKYDKPISVYHKEYNKSLQLLNSAFDIGLHPGYADGTSTDGIKKQIVTLTSITGKEIHRSRHHFLRIQLPTTYQHLLQAGVTHDYSMGFAGNIGFRAATAHSFKFYDLSNEKSTELVVHPF